MEDDKRMLPRHIDGRIKIGYMPIKNFIEFLPFLIIGIFLILNYFNPVTLFFGVALIGLVGCLFSEFQNKESGIDILLDIIKYSIEGDIVYERSCSNETKKFIWNKIK